MAENLCLRCQIARDGDSKDDGFYAPVSKKLLDVTGYDCAWSRLSDGQREHCLERGVSPERFCELRARATATWLAEWDKEHGIELDNAHG